jgi:hypothetical protein
MKRSKQTLITNTIQTLLISDLFSDPRFQNGKKKEKKKELIEP